jgi:uncharacterized protein YbaR (Trm112 family)
MKMDYQCPRCEGQLLLNEQLILAAKYQKEQGMLILMNPELGNYETIYHPSKKIENGLLYDFFCPICHYKLKSDLNENLAMVMMTDDKGKKYELHFSRVAGQKSTYKIMGKSVEHFGIDAPHYLDFINIFNMR